MSYKTIKKTAQIKAPASRVWDVLFNEKYTKQWYPEFGAADARAKTDWNEGSRVQFLDGNQAGIGGWIETSRHPTELAIVFDSLIKDGVEYKEHEEAKKFSGTREVYRMDDSNGVTSLFIESDMDVAHYDHMSQAWDRALDKVKNLAESQN